jgi:chitinase
MRKSFGILIFFLLAFGAFGRQQKPPFEVIAYYSGNGDNIEQYSIGKLTQIIFSFLVLKNDTLFFPSPQRKEALRKVVALKQKQPELKVLISMGGWGGCKTCSDVFAEPESRKRFAASVGRVMKEYNVDGIDIDWEYPAIPGFPGHTYRPEDKENFTDLMFQIRKVMGPHGELSFAAGGFTHFLEKSVDWMAVMPYLSRVNLMTYDLVHGFSTRTGHHTALYSHIPEQTESTDNCVQWLLSHGVPSEKLVIGSGFYARIWEKVSKTNNGLFQEGKFMRSVDYKDFSYLEPDSGWVHQWDLQAMAPYAYHRTADQFATYDNSESLLAKVKYARSFKLGGIMFWELACDVPGNGLLDSLHESVEKTEAK